MLLLNVTYSNRFGLIFWTFAWSKILWGYDSTEVEERFWCVRLRVIMLSHAFNWWLLLSSASSRFYTQKLRGLTLPMLHAQIDSFCENRCKNEYWFYRKQVFLRFAGKKGGLTNAKSFFHTMFSGSFHAVASCQFCTSLVESCCFGSVIILLDMWMLFFHSKSIWWSQTEFG